MISELARRRWPRRRSRVDLSGRQIVRIRPLRLRFSDPTNLRASERCYRRLDRLLRRLASESKTEMTSLVSYHPLVGGHCGHSWADARVFVARDDWAAAPRKRPYWPLYRDAYGRIARQCTAVFAVSAELAERVAPGAGQTLPNGVDDLLWSNDLSDTNPMSVERYAVYSGSIEARLDLDLVDRILTVIPDLVLAGPVMTAELRAELLRRPGVHLTGHLDQRTLAAVTRGAAVGVVPHRVTSMTAAMSPLKMFEYLAAGIPVVATDLPGIREARHLSDRVWLCQEAGQWDEALRSALLAGSASVAERRRVLDEVSWRRRLSPLVEAATNGPA
ncbi:glycosyltransferase [Modestobacter sp. VKM Ac-2979]|uniref:glycosyltransferase n=1 Tax=unclassified Modestobacter TaxID=2643866 RepID=UPI0022ABAE7E|nr:MULTISPECIES: glycosyltransferase [unclassified Modestobacter]MCZ2813418.1 glycosyltransferase [Modestobacter sp. VKM Ac-2979]MCZ2842390.1 glycosyltransferase [Modestobacter sp. VKM Ac-2980]